MVNRPRSCDHVLDGVYKYIGILSERPVRNEPCKQYRAREGGGGSSSCRHGTTPQIAVLQLVTRGGVQVYSRSGGKEMLYLFYSGASIGCRKDLSCCENGNETHETSTHL